MRIMMGITEDTDSFAWTQEQFDALIEVTPRIKEKLKTNYKISFMDLPDFWNQNSTSGDYKLKKSPMSHSVLILRQLYWLS